jgi:DNA repair protein RadA/Sms
MKRKPPNIKKATVKLMTLAEVDLKRVSHQSTTHKSIDALFGGHGIAGGSVNLIAGPPGIGKSTLLSYVCELFSEAGKDVLYVSGEESLEQMKQRTHRLSLKGTRFFVADDKGVPLIIQKAKKLKPAIMVIDSVQTMKPSLKEYSHKVDNAVQELMNWAKHQSTPILLVGHYTKKGKIAGSNNLQHMVDAVFEIKVADDTNEKIVRPIKNRFGETNTHLRYLITDKGLEMFHETRHVRDARDVRMHPVLEENTGE